MVLGGFITLPTLAQSQTVIMLLQILLFTPIASAEPSADFVVYKNPQCDCCNKWISHVREAGYSVLIPKSSNMRSIKQKFGVNPKYQSCHTAVHQQSGLVFEGHVPVNHISALINDHQADDIGLAVPGMPVGSPGMEMGNRKDPYTVLLLKRSAKPTPFAYENPTGELSGVRE